MAERILSSLSILYRGVPVGTARMIEYDREQPIAPLLPAELRVALDRTPVLGLVDCKPLPAFAQTFGPALQRLKDAEKAWEALPSCVGIDDAAASRDAAWEALLALSHELELRDDTGALVPVPVQHFDGQHIAVDLDAMPAGVLARLRARRADGSDTTPPAV